VYKKQEIPMILL